MAGATTAESEDFATWTIAQLYHEQHRLEAVLGTLILAPDLDQETRQRGLDDLDARLARIARALRRTRRERAPKGSAS